MWKGTALFALALAGCTWISAEKHDERLDADEDGYPWPADCEPDDKNAHPGATEVCNGIDDNCDDVVDEDAVDRGTWYLDADEDTWGDGDRSVLACEQPPAHVDRPGDCDDTSDLAHPGLTEVCNDHLDNDCDGTDNGCDARGVFALAEGDFYGVGLHAYDQYGLALAFGPLDAVDGADLAIGGPAVDGAGSDRGAVFVHQGPIPNTLHAASATVHVDGDVDYARVGTSLAWVGDVDGDEHPDLLVGAPSDAAYAGRIYLLHGPGITTGSISQGQAGTGVPNARYGQVVAALGDVNEDGKGDFAVLATGDLYAEPPAPATVHVFRGPAANLDSTAAVATLTHATCRPNTLAAAGDVDGNGVTDLLVGSSNCTIAHPNGGAVVLVSGDVQGSVALEDALATFVPGAENWLLGYGLAGGDDVDGDGTDDVLLGALGYMAEGEVTMRGMALLYTTSKTGVVGPDDATARIVGPPESYFGISVALPGDVNADGYGDVLIGAPYYRVEPDVVGAAFLYYGPVVGDLGPDDADAVFIGPVTSMAGFPVFAVGDVDGDDFDDLFIGAPGSGTAGSLYGFLGRGR